VKSIEQICPGPRRRDDEFGPVGRVLPASGEGRAPSDRDELEREIRRLRATNASLQRARKVAEDVAYFARDMQTLPLAELLDFVPREAARLFHAKSCYLYLPAATRAKQSLHESRVACHCRPLMDVSSHPAVYEALTSGHPVVAARGPSKRDRCEDCGSSEGAQVVLPFEFFGRAVREEETCRAPAYTGILCACGVANGAGQDQASLRYQANLIHHILGDIFANALAYADTKRAAGVDPLTGLATRRVFEPQLRREVERARRHKRPFGVVMIDVDRLREINDNNGYAAGDEVLASLADILVTQTRAVDLSARYGGDEFAVMLPEVNLNGAVEAIERVREFTARTSFPEAGRPVTISAGIAGNEDGAAAADILHAADMALHRAKCDGGNSVVASAAVDATTEPD